MKYVISILFCLPLILHAENHNTKLLKNISKINRVIFGSCNHQFASQKHWNIMQKLNPDVVIIGGDIVYADSIFSFPGIELDYRIMKNKYDFKELKKQVPLIGIWDDHDFGENNGGAENTYKEVTKSLFLDLLEEEINSPRRMRPGLYTSYEFGPEDKRVKIILLNNRYFKDEITMLGELQWQWLESELKNSKAKQHILMAGTSFFYPQDKKGEEWDDYPAEKERLFSLLLKYNPAGLLLLSGDKHFSSIFKADAYGTTWYEFLSSGLTHSTPKMFIKQKVLANTANLVSKSYFGRAFGEILYDWNKDKPILTLNIRSAKSGKIVKSETIKY